MNDEVTVATWDLLRGFGFRPDDEVNSDVIPGLSFDFGNLILSASCATNLRFVEVVLFTGVLSTPRKLSEVIFELPRRVNSRRQCAAWIVWNLDQHSEGRVFRTVRNVGWIEEGRQNQTLLPWIREMAAYASRPRCTVRRDWMRLALKTLAEFSATSADDALACFSFGDSVLSIRCEGRVVVLPGEGLPWTVQFEVQVGKLRRAPKRFMHEYIEVSILESRLTIGGTVYEGMVEASTETSRVKVQ